MPMSQEDRDAIASGKILSQEELDAIIIEGLASIQHLPEEQRMGKLALIYGTYPFYVTRLPRGKVDLDPLGNWVYTRVENLDPVHRLWLLAGVALIDEMGAPPPPR